MNFSLRIKIDFNYQLKSCITGSIPIHLLFPKGYKVSTVFFYLKFSSTISANSDLCPTVVLVSQNYNCPNAHSEVFLSYKCIYKTGGVVVVAGCNYLHIDHNRVKSTTKFQRKSIRSCLQFSPDSSVAQIVS